MASSSPSDASRVVLPDWPLACPPVLWSDELTDAEFRVIADRLAYGYFNKSSTRDIAGIWRWGMDKKEWPHPPVVVLVLPCYVTAPTTAHDDWGTGYGWASCSREIHIPLYFSSKEDREDFDEQQWLVAYRDLDEEPRRAYATQFVHTRRSQEWRRLPWPLIALAMKAD